MGVSPESSTAAGGGQGAAVAPAAAEQPAAGAGSLQAKQAPSPPPPHDSAVLQIGTAPAAPTEPLPAQRSWVKRAASLARSPAGGAQRDPTDCCPEGSRFHRWFGSNEALGWWMFAAQVVISTMVLLFAIICMAKGGSASNYLPLITAVVFTHMPSRVFTSGGPEGDQQGSTSSAVSPAAARAGGGMQAPASAQQPEEAGAAKASSGGSPSTAAGEQEPSALTHRQHSELPQLPLLLASLDTDRHKTFAKFVVLNCFAITILIFCFVRIVRAIDAYAAAERRFETLPRAERNEDKLKHLDEVNRVESIFLPLVMAIFGLVMPAPSAPSTSPAGKA